MGACHQARPPLATSYCPALSGPRPVCMYAKEGALAQPKLTARPPCNSPASQMALWRNGLIPVSLSAGWLPAGCLPAWQEGHLAVPPASQHRHWLSTLPCRAPPHCFLGCTMLPTPPRRPHLKIERLYWHLTAQVQCVLTSTQAGKASWAEASPVCVSWHTHEEMNKL